MSLIPFDFDGHQIRVEADESGGLWFVAKDACIVLGYADHKDAVSKHTRERGRRIAPLLTPGGLQNVTYVNESELYRLIMRSKLEGAERFQDWVTEEVIPSIRKTGSYTKPAAPAFIVPANLHEALILAANLEGERMRLAAVVEEQAPKVEAHDRFLDTSETFTLSHLAKSCRTTVIKMNQWLRENGYIHKNHADNPPNAKAIDDGLMVVVNRGYQVVSEDDGTQDRTRPQTRVTTRGMSVLSNLYAAAHEAQGTLRLLAGGAK